MPPPATAVRRSSVVAATPVPTASTENPSTNDTSKVSNNSSSNASLLHPTLPDLPKKIWSYDQEPNLSNLSLKNTSELTINLLLGKFLPRKLFKNDYLSYCKLLGIRPHPSILPIEHSVDGSTVVLPSMKLANRRQQRYGGSNSSSSTTTTHDVKDTPTSAVATNSSSSTPSVHHDEHDTSAVPHEEPEYFNFSFIKDIIIKQILFGNMDMFALTMALRTSTTIVSLNFTKANLTTKQLFLLADTLPFTTITSLTIDDNVLSEDSGTSLDPPETILPPQSITVPSTIPSDGLPPVPENRRGSVSGNNNRRTSIVAPTDRPVSPPKASVTASLTTDSNPPLISNNNYLRNRETVWSYFVKRYSPLVRCSLRSCGISSKEAVYLGNALSLNTNLQELVLSHNRSLADEGLTNLCKGLIENRTLVSLQLADTGLSHTSMNSLLSVVTSTTLTVQQEKEREIYNEMMVTELRNEVNKLGLSHYNSQIITSVTNAKFPILTSLRPPPPEPVAAPAPAPVLTKGKAPAPAPAPAPVTVPEIVLQPTDPAALQTGCTSIQTIDISANMMIGTDGLRSLVTGMVTPPNVPVLPNKDISSSTVSTSTEVPPSTSTPSTSPVKPTNSESTATPSTPVKNNETENTTGSSPDKPSSISFHHHTHVKVLAVYHCSYPDPSPNSVLNSNNTKQGLQQPTTKDIMETLKNELSTVNCTLCC